MVLVTWNATADLPDFVASLDLGAIPGLELIVVDNGSADGSAEMIERLHPAAHVIRLVENVGFAEAADRGIAESRGEAVALLNYDLRLHPGYLAHCTDALDQDLRLGSVQGILVRPGGQTLDSAGHVVTRGRWFRNRGENLAVGAGRWAPASTFGVTAAAAVYRRRMLDEVRDVAGHVFDRSFFAYLEDVDLDCRSRWLGWEAAVVDGATAEHAHSGSGARRTPAIQRHIVKNRLLVLYRNEDSGNLVRDLPWIAGQQIARWGLALLSSPSSLLGVWDFVRLRRQQRPIRAAVRRSRKISPAQMRSWFRTRPATDFSTRTGETGAGSRTGL